MSDLTKKVRYKKDGNADCDNAGNVYVISDELWREKNPPPPKLQDDIKDQQQNAPVYVRSTKRNPLKAFAVCLGLLCLLLLIAVIVLLVLSSQDKNNRIMERNQLLGEISDLTSERDELQSSYNDMKSLNRNLMQKTSQLENEKEHLQAVNVNLTKERDELQDHINNKTLEMEARIKTLTKERDELKNKLSDCDKKTLDMEASIKTLNEEQDELKKKLSDCEKTTLDMEARIKTLTEERDDLRKRLSNCEKAKLDMEARIKTLTEERDELKKKLSDFDDYSQQGWVYFSRSFYYISSYRANWYNSRYDCRRRGADLLIVNTKEEQEFLNQYHRILWIGLTDREREGTWKWVDGTLMTISFWPSWEPNNIGNEDCLETKFYTDEKSWNDAKCGDRNFWICEKKMIP